MPLLEHWSNNQKPIGAQAIAPHYIEAFQQVGFVLGESRFWMIRPIEPLLDHWSSEWILSPLASTKASEIAALLEDAFSESIGQYGKRDLAAHLVSVAHFFENYDEDSDCGRASTMIVDKQPAKIAAVCMVDMHKRMPTIRFVAVTPNCRRRGLATKLLKRAINTLAPEYDWVKLALTDGNPAVAVYQNLGFVAGEPLHQLLKPASH